MPGEVTIDNHATVFYGGRDGSVMLFDAKFKTRGPHLLEVGGYAKVDGPSYEQRLYEVTFSLPAGTKERW